MRFAPLASILVVTAACDETPNPALALEPAATADGSTAPVTSASASAPPVAKRAPVASAAPTAEPAAEPPHDPRCPPEMARIGRFCVDRWEAHLVGPNGDIHPRNIPPLEGTRYEARSAPGVFPQGHINRDQSEAACKASEKRLCAWIEWRRACQGSKWQRWPYGNAREEGACNSGKTHLVRKFFGDDPNKWTQKNFNDPRLNEQPDFLAKTGTHERCVGPDGIYDMVGNLHEWVIDTVSSTFLRKMDEEGMHREKQPYALGNGMFLGGFYSTRSEHGQGCFFVTVAHSANYYDYSTGFRCCKDAAPENAKK